MAKDKLLNFSKEQTVGDIFITLVIILDYVFVLVLIFKQNSKLKKFKFERKSIFQSYSNYTNNFFQNKKIIKKYRSTTFCFRNTKLTQFLHDQVNKHPGRLNFSDLFIHPSQRIPRYDLFIQVKNFKKI